MLQAIDPSPVHVRLFSFGRCRGWRVVTSRGWQAGGGGSCGLISGQDEFVAFGAAAFQTHSVTAPGILDQRTAWHLAAAVVTRTLKRGGGGGGHRRRRSLLWTVTEKRQMENSSSINNRFRSVMFTGEYSADTACGMFYYSVSVGSFVRHL